MNISKIFAHGVQYPSTPLMYMNLGPQYYIGLLRIHGWFPYLWISSPASRPPTRQPVCIGAHVRSNLFATCPQQLPKQSSRHEIPANSTRPKARTIRSRQPHTSRIAPPLQHMYGQTSSSNWRDSAVGLPMEKWRRCDSGDDHNACSWGTYNNYLTGSP